MKTVIDPGQAQPTVTLLDNISFSSATDREGRHLDLQLSILTPLRPKRDGSDQEERLPTIIWSNGGGWHTPQAMRNTMVPELVFLAKQGYNVVSYHYRNSAEAPFPAQIVDLKTCIRFLRANAGKYGIDPDRIGVMGRSAGGHVSTFAAMNTNEFISEEWPGFSSEVQACCDMFGPVDIPACTRVNLERMKDPNARWKHPGETHEGALLGWEGDLDQFLKKGAQASPVSYVSDKLCPILIMHGDADPLVPCQISEDFYQQLQDAGLGDRADLYILKGAGHGTPEFFQDSVKEIILQFFDKYLKG